MRLHSFAVRPQFSAVLGLELTRSSLATLCHQVLIVSPEGQYLVKLMDNLHKMVPYGMVRQTLRIGNAATMIAGMMKIFLAKLSVGGVSNWIGITSNAADGQNLMQR